MRLDGLSGYVVSIEADGEIKDELVPTPATPSTILLSISAFSHSTTYGSYNEGATDDSESDYD